jgi:predicted PurR-regulated permease PerM
MSFPPPTSRQARILWFTLTAFAIAVLVALVGLLAWGVGLLVDRLSAVLMPVVVALILAYILDPVVEFFTRKKLPRIWAVLLVFLLGLLLVGGIVGSVVPGAIRESRGLINDLPQNAETLRLKTEDFVQNSPMAHLIPATWRAAAMQWFVSPTNNAAAEVTNSADPSVPELSAWTNGVTPIQPGAAAVHGSGSAANNAVGEPSNDLVVAALKRIAQWIPAQLGKVRSWVESSIGFVLMPICLFYFLLEKYRIHRSWPDYLPLTESRTKEEVVFVLRAINDCMIVFFRGQVLVALCVGTLLAIGYMILGLNYAVLLGVVAGVLGIIPYLGTIVSLVLALTVAAVQYGDWRHPLTVLGIAAAVKVLEDLVISPKIMGNRSGLHPLTIILAVMIGATLLGGFLGAMLAIPMTAVLRTLMFRYVWKKRTDGGKSANVTVI